MAIRDILTYPDNFLRKQARPVKDIDGDLQKIIADMGQTMYAAPGAGLASIQIGVEQSIMVYDVSPKDEGRSLQVLINPRIVSQEGQVISENEGCLSVPDFRADVKRASQIVVEGLDRNGNPLRFDAEGYIAIVLQHELDHLNGALFIDHLSSLKRGLFKRQLKKKLNPK